jgi:hypothetical protein
VNSTHQLGQPGPTHDNIHDDVKHSLLKPIFVDSKLYSGRDLCVWPVTLDMPGSYKQFVLLHTV